METKEDVDILANVVDTDTTNVVTPVVDTFFVDTPFVNTTAPTYNVVDDSGAPRKTLVAVLLAIAIMLILVILYHMFLPRGLAKDLAHRGWIVYYRLGCRYCTKQKQILGGKFSKFIECDAKGNQIGGYTSHPELPCNSPIIKGFPFWYNTRTKKFRTGLQDISALKQMAH